MLKLRICRGGDVDGAEFCFMEKHTIPAASVSVSGDYEDYALQTASVG